MVNAYRIIKIKEIHKRTMGPINKKTVFICIEAEAICLRTKAKEDIFVSLEENKGIVSVLSSDMNTDFTAFEEIKGEKFDVSFEFYGTFEEDCISIIIENYPAIVFYIFNKKELRERMLLSMLRG